jgi:adenylyl-sulfate kinase
MISNSDFSKKGLTIWFTGLSGAGKSTLSEKLKSVIGEKCFVLDGDIIRKGLNSDLGFSKEDRKENIRRISEVAKLFNIAGFIVIVAFISPYEFDRDEARRIHEESGLKFLEVYINTSLEVCESRDVKGLYLKARKGEIKQFTGISDPYEAPQNPELTLDTDKLSVDQCIDFIMNKINNQESISDGISKNIPFSA